MREPLISGDAEDRLDELFLSWQMKWTQATTDAQNERSLGGLEAMEAVYATLGLETP